MPTHDRQAKCGCLCANAGVDIFAEHAGPRRRCCCFQTPKAHLGDAAHSAKLTQQQLVNGDQFGGCEIAHSEHSGVRSQEPEYTMTARARKCIAAPRISSNLRTFRLLTPEFCILCK